MQAVILLSGHGILRAIVALSTPMGWVRRLPKPERTNKPMSVQNDRFRPFQHTQPSEKVAEEELHHLIHP
jgi:hypothetical protein